MNKTAELTLHLKSQEKCPRLRVFSGQAVYGVHLTKMRLFTENVILKTLIYLLVVNYYNLSLYARPQTIRFDRLSIDDGLSNSYVTCILQDRKGFMWFGTQDGLNKYDGYNFTVFKHDPANTNSLSDNFVRSITETKDGILWIGTESGGLCKFDPATETFINYKHEPQNPHSLIHNRINVIYEDRDTSRVILWIGTNEGGLDRFDPQSNTFTHYKHNPTDSSSLSNNSVQAIREDLAGNLWVGTLNGLNRYDKASGKWTRYYHDQKNPNSLNHSSILTIHEDHEGTLWIGTYSGLNKMEAETAIGFKEIIQGYGIQSLCEDQFGKLWIGSYLGIDHFDPDQQGKKRFTRYKYDSGDPKSLSGDMVTTTYKDRSGVLWFGTGGSGISKLNPSVKNFVHYRHIPGNPNSLSHPSVRGIYEDADGILWVGGYGGLNRIDRKTGHFENYREENAGVDGLDSDLIYTIIGDPENKNILWIGTEGSGLYKFFKDSKKVKRYFKWSRATDRYASYILSGGFVFDLYIDSKGILWIATNGGLNRFERETEQVAYYNYDPDNSHSISGNDTRIVYEDHYGYLWVGTEANGINRFNRRTEQFTRFRHDPESPNSLSNNRIKSIYEDRTGTLWIGTNGGGLNRFDRKTETFKHYTEKDGLPNDVIYGILEDDNGNLWLSTNKGLSKFTPPFVPPRGGNIRGVFRNYDVNDGLQSNEFNTAAYFKSKSGEMFFGGINGLNSFFPDDIKDSPYIPPVVITEFQILNKPVPIGEMKDERVILPRQISDTEEIELTYKDYLFSFEFAALSYAAPEKNKYAYKMEGFDKDWLYTDATNRSATYTNLPAGDYTFRVKASNQDGLWNPTGTSIRLIIAPPPWKTWWAYLIYFIVGLGMVVGVIEYRTIQARVKARQLEYLVEVRTAEVERQKKKIEIQREKLAELDKMKSRFFANISHEFRTPLTLIKGPLESVRAKIYGTISDATDKQLDISLNNVDRLHKLVDELLDLSRLEAGKLKLEAVRKDLNGFLCRVVDSFYPSCKKHGIKLNWETDTDRIELYFDENKLEKVMNNLLSNAIKFTPVGGKITVATVDATREVEEKGAGLFVTIRVADTGTGIPPEAMPHIFDRFYQVDSSPTRKHEGTGIGLALTKELVELHGGEITMESDVGAGTTFTITLPKGRMHLADDEVISEMGELESRSFGTEYNTIDAEVSVGIEQDGHTSAAQPEQAPKVLIVEDNVEMRDYLREHLEPLYAIFEAGDGKEGLEKTVEIKPDLIISDIMMPEMDGIEMTRELKQKNSTRVIPIILLTARADEEDRIAGLETHADDYITKPFNMEELVVRIRNLIEERQQLREQFSRKVIMVEPDQLDLDTVDKTFLEQTLTVVEAHLSEGDFNVQALAEMVFMGKRQFERRLRKLTGLTPAEFIRQIRLKRAQQYLEEKALSTVAEVSHTVGFDNVGYFIRLYHQTFGQLPGELLRG